MPENDAGANRLTTFNELRTDVRGSILLKVPAKCAEIDPEVDSVTLPPTYFYRT